MQDWVGRPIVNGADGKGIGREVFEHLGAANGDTLRSVGCVDRHTTTDVDFGTGPVPIHLCELDQSAVADSNGDFDYPAHDQGFDTASREELERGRLDARAAEGCGVLEPARAELVHVQHAFDEDEGRAISGWAGNRRGGAVREQPRARRASQVQVLRVALRRGIEGARPERPHPRALVSPGAEDPTRPAAICQHRRGVDLLPGVPETPERFIGTLGRRHEPEGRLVQ